MCLRISSALGVAAMLAACASESGAPMGELIDCAIGPGAEFERVCTLERVQDTIVVHHPDGGFRRLRMEAADLATLDGATMVERTGTDASGSIEFEIDGDRYRIATAPAREP